MEIVRRYYDAMCKKKKGQADEDEVLKAELIMNRTGIDASYRTVVKAALDKAAATDGPATAIELNDGTIITGKTSKLMGASASALLNALKRLGGLNDEFLLLPQVVMEPLQRLKVENLGNHNPRLHVDELLLALSICAVTDSNAEIAMQQLDKLRGLEAHSSVILSEVDKKTFKKLGVNLTCEPKYQTKKLYHK